MAMKDKHLAPNWLPKLSLLRPSGETEVKEREALERLETEVKQLRSALRWSMGFIVNVALGMEITDGVKVETAQIKQGIKEGLKRSNVPRGVLNNLDDALALIKEWDLKTFRVEQDIEVLDKTAEQVVLKHADCPEVYKTMRRSAPFLIDRVSTEHYLYLPSPLDFLCVPHTLCRSVLVSWLSDGKFQVEELCWQRESCPDSVCAFVIRQAPVPSRRTGSGPPNPAGV